MPGQQKDNPDRALIARVLEQGLRNVAVTTNPLSSALQCVILSASPGAVELSFAPSEAYTQGAGIISGGITATMLDFGLAFAALSTCGAGEGAMSVGLTVAYLAPVQPGSVVVQASVLSAGFRLSQAEARLLDGAGNLLATAQGPLAMKRVSNG